MFGGNKFGGSSINWPVIAAITIGLVIAFLAATRLVSYTNTHVSMEAVPVMAHNVGPYTVLQPSDIAMQPEVKGSLQPGAISNSNDADGQMTTTPLYQGDQIESNSLVNPVQVTGKEIVTVNIDLARGDAGYLKPGDLCDAWWIPGDESAQTPGVGWVQVTSNAVVVDIKDSSGKSLFAGGNAVEQAIIGSSGSVETPAVAVLAVNEADVSRIVGGSMPKSQNIVLVKKYNTQETPRH